MKRISNRGEPIVRIPPVVEPVPVDVRSVDVAVEVRHVAVAVRVAP